MSRPKIDDAYLTLAELFDLWPALVTVFQSHGMLCFGCPITPFHTVADACQEYRLDLPRFRNALNRVLSETEESAVLRSPSGRDPA